VIRHQEMQATATVNCYQEPLVTRVKSWADCPLRSVTWSDTAVEPDWKHAGAAALAVAGCPSLLVAEARTWPSLRIWTWSVVPAGAVKVAWNLVRHRWNLSAEGVDGRRGHQVGVHRLPRLHGLPGLVVRRRLAAVERVGVEIGVARQATNAVGPRSGRLAAQLVGEGGARRGGGAAGHGG